ncbi:hypothetical protein C8A05DRAFT_44012 [Staphylotrichum tortipilum]|uniref:Clock-controlled pheromone ccg-4 n=1 Tax=Staphylotrichum tortipilum TaxID=2831512 RepID=A0AAN6MKH6_9PEZI|nr:hypothetical protein C8A05DRAFT_44012 [Staphylotrichum longicolle]
MKFSVPLTILAAAASVDAAAVAHQEKRYCSGEDQACHTVERAAEAFSDALRANTKLPARAETGSEVASIAARQLRELALAIAASHGDPVAYFNALGYGAPQTDSKTEKREAEPWCDQFLGGSCLATRDTSPATRDTSPATRDTSPAKRDARAWCTQFPGMPCWKREVTAAISKREAAPEAEAEPDRYCTRFVGSSCWKRDGSSAAAEEVKRCEAEGGACWQAKRAAMAVVNTIDHGNVVKMARDPQAWCIQFPSKPCWKRDAACNGPAGACTKATRDLHAIYNAARTIIEA